MSACVSRRGEFGSHDLDQEFICTLCGSLDEDALLSELRTLRELRARVEAVLADLPSRYTVGPENFLRVMSLQASDIRAALNGGE